MPGKTRKTRTPKRKSSAIPAAATKKQRPAAATKKQRPATTRKQRPATTIARQPRVALTNTPRLLLTDVRKLILAARKQVAQSVNSTLALLYWQVGWRIRQDVLANKRAEYGKQVVAALGSELSNEFGRGFTARNLASMIRFADAYPDPKILHTLCAKLSWSHLRLIVYLEDDLRRDFYAEMCRVEGWSVRTLEQKIRGMLYERTALSKKPDQLIRKEIDQLRNSDKLTPDLVFRDPYILDFLRLNDRYIEKDLEDAIIRELESFILELGVGFAFVARQKRIPIDNDDHYLDLLFYHRGLRRLVAIELKLGDFQAADKGQMELYLRWLARHEMQRGEKRPIGLILCAGNKTETVELLELEKSGIRVASYWLELLPRKLLQRKLHDAVVLARGLAGAKEATNT